MKTPISTLSKKSIVLLSMMAGCFVTASAQQYLVVENDQFEGIGGSVLTTEALSVDNIDKITYEVDPDFDSKLLPGMLAADAKTTIFSAALQLTGLADSLKKVKYQGYFPQDNRFYYKSYVNSEVAWFNERRLHQFTVFVETDDVFAQQGITNIDQLKAYAKQVYDVVYPEDASVSDPTDRRNSLNRFVAYHVLCHGSSYDYLTVYDGKGLENSFDRNLMDVSAWYATLMPHAALKCSYPEISGADRGIYLNRRGLKNGADRYGYQSRGAKITLDEAQNSFDHPCFNGYYFYIDRILTYDQQVRDNVLGGELWRVDFKTLSSDIMNNSVELRGSYYNDDNPNTPDDSYYPRYGRNFIYDWKYLENISANPEVLNRGLVARRAHSNFWSWQGDEMNLFGLFDFTVKLPPLPVGEWEVRIGFCAINTRAPFDVYLNDEKTIDSLVASRLYFDAEMSFSELPIQFDVLDYMLQHFITLSSLEDNSYLLTDLITGEQIIVWKNPYATESNQFWNTNFTLTGRDPESGKTVNWTQRAKEYREQAKIDFINSQPKPLRGPKACQFFNTSSTTSFSQRDNLVRYVLGRLVSDGKSDNYLRFKARGSARNQLESMFDYFEFVPKAIVDNTEIPEE